MHVTQLAVLHAEQMAVRRAAAAARRARAERAEHLHRAEHLIHHEAPIGDVHAGRNADLAAVRRRTFAGVRAALDAHAGEAPRHEIELLLEERIEIRVGRGNERAARRALFRGDRVPLLGGGILQVMRRR